MRKLKLLTGKDEWKEWKNENFSDPFDHCEEPNEFPCFGYASVYNWAMQLEGACYLYLEDLDGMLRTLANIP